METSTNQALAIVKAQLVFLLSTLTESNFDRNLQEIRSLSEQHGLDSYLHFIRRLLVQTQSRLVSAAPSSAFDSSTSLTFRMLVQETQRLARDPFLADRFQQAVDKGEGDVFRHFDLARFVDRVGLRPLERLILASSIVSGATRKDFANQAATMVQVEFENAALALCKPPAFEVLELSLNQVAKLMHRLLSEPPPESPILDAIQCRALVAAAQAKHGNDAVAPILHDIFQELSLPPNTSLVQILMHLGADITSDAECVKSLLMRFGISNANPPRDDQVQEIITALARFASAGESLCDVGALVRALGSFGVSLDWAAVIKSFDWPDRHGVDTATLKLLIAVLVNSPREADPHAVTGFWTKWNNSLYQLRVLDALLSLPADTFNFVSLPGRRIVTVDDVAGASPTIKSLAANVQGHTWNSLDLFSVMVRLADSESVDIRNCVREMLDKAVKISAEIVHMGLLQVPDPSWNEIRSDYSQKLLQMFLAGHPNHQLVFMRIWQIEPTYLSDAFRRFYEESPLNITRILDVAQDLKILEQLLEVRPFVFSLDVASLASRREYLNLDKWLADNVTNHGEEFLHAIIVFLDTKMESEKASRVSDPAVDNRTMPLNPQTITIFLRTLRNSTIMSEADVAYCLEVRNACLQVHPRLMSLIPGSDAEPGFSVVSYSAEIEAEVDGIYKQMYDEQTTIDDVIAMLQRSKSSSNSRDQEVFSCMLHFLFDEYKFFQSYYPTRELAMTGYLFGSLIQHELVDYIPLGIAIRYILDALSCPVETNLFRFGVQALSRFESRLVEWQPLCAALLRIPHLAEHRPDLVTTIQRAVAAGAGGTADGQSLVIGDVIDLQPVFTAIQPDSIEGELQEPPEELSDKILFIVNNLAPSNFDSKLVEMKEQFEDAYSRWFANYLVDQRISTEPNNHGLYLRFLDALDRQALTKYVLQETFVKSAALLNAERTLQLSSERTTLKNVGSWLGTITLARDRPIRHKNLSFKDLLLEGYDNSRLIVAIPFICNTLAPCAKSTVFRPPNPWLMAVVSLLAELYHFADLKLNLKFEIEVLCKGLNIDLDTVEATTVLRNRPLSDGLADPPLPEFDDINSLPIGPYDAPSHLGVDSQVMPLGPSSPSDSRALGAQIEAILATLVLHVNITPQLNPYHVNPTFKRAIQMAVDRAVREIILPVVERSVTIAGISTRELVSKDYATEASEDKLRSAARQMAQKLAGSLALVTCKEPLKSNLATHIRQFLGDNNFADMASDQVVLHLVQDNLDVACAAIEKAAMDRAFNDVESNFAASFESRASYAARRHGGQFWDQAMETPQYNGHIPDKLRIQPQGVLPRQQKVYDEFDTESQRRISSRPSSTVSYSRNDGMTPGLYPPSPAPDHGQSFSSHQEAVERFTTLSRDLDAVMMQIPIQSLANLPPNHDIRHLIRGILFIATDGGDRQQTPLLISQKIVQSMYKTPSQLGREVYIALLEQLCTNYSEIAKEALNWLLYAEDERKFNIPTTVTLYQTGLLNISQHDVQLARSLAGPEARPTLLNFVAGLIRECLSREPPLTSQSGFANTIEALARLSQTNKATEDVDRLIDDLRGIRRPPTTAPAVPTPAAAVTPPPDESLIVRAPSTKPYVDQLREKLLQWFQRWVTIFERSPSPEKNFVPFINQLTKQGILKVEDVSSLFFRVCAESSVNTYVQCVAAGDFEYAFQALDAMSRLIVYIIKYHGDASGVNNDQAKVHYFTKILSIFVLVLANAHEEEGLGFHQKPFFRFFSSLLNDLHGLEAQLGSAYFHLLLAISDTFSSLQPIYFPGFAFSWMSLISHRLFMPKLLLSDNREGWSAFHKLLLSLFKFLAPFLKDADFQTASRDLYRGALRLLLLLLHDFPEFLSEYYFTLCDVLPPTCIQLRNIVLSAFPSILAPLPDPHLKNFTFDTLPEMGPIPPVLSDFTSALKAGDMRSYVELYLLGRGSPSFLPSLKDRLKGNDSGDEPYNLPLINALVMFIGVSSVAQAKSKNGSTLFVAGDPGVIMLQYLANNMDIEGQHHLLSACVLHLRYHNAHTHWFASLLLYFFAEAKDDVLREVMTKVLLERVMHQRPHPWGVLVTFIELLRGPKYEFWNKEFTRAVPEVRALLDSVAQKL